ncbi:hypothetical protein [Rosistilla oblonga]|uniref:hypothetical protein n=1 Tax=Rosistilla oblonga TaxID=2527990 RepID=UPI003A96A02F
MTENQSVNIHLVLTIIGLLFALASALAAWYALIQSRIAHSLMTKIVAAEKRSLLMHDIMHGGSLIDKVSRRLEKMEECKEPIPSDLAGDISELRLKFKNMSDQISWAYHKLETDPNPNALSLEQLRPNTQALVFQAETLLQQIQQPANQNESRT